ncbi:MAG: diguanylate cyclase [Bacillota bacterium]
MSSFRTRIKFSSRASALLALLLIVPAVSALEPGKAFHDYASDSWSVEQGLPQITVLSITQDARGYIWVGTQDGLARFDGVTFQAYLPTHWIQSLANGPDGSLWLGMNKGAAWMADGEVHELGAAKGAKDVNPQADVRTLLFEGGQLYAATNAGLLRVDKDGLRRDPSVPAEQLFALLGWRGALWVGGVGHLYQITEGGVKTLAAPGGAGTQVTGLTAYDDALWIGTNRGLFRYANGGWQRATGDPAELRLAVNAFYADSDGNFWVSTNAGLAHLTGESMQQFIRAGDYESAAQIESMYEDREHNLWVGTHAHGLTRLWNGYTRRYSAAEGLGDPVSFSVAPAVAGGMWVGTVNGVYLLRDQHYRLAVPGSELPAPTAYTLLDDGQRLWIGTFGGVALYENGRVTRPPALAPLDGLIVHGLARDHTGAIWIATLDGLFRYANGALTRYGMESGFKDVRCRLVFETHDGRILIGTLAGLYQFDGTRFTPLGAEAGLGDSFITAISELKDGKLLVGTFSEDKLFLYDGAHWRTVTSDQGLPKSTPTFMTLGAAGEWLWVGGLRGIYRVKLADFLEVAQNAQKDLTVQGIVSEKGDWPGSIKGPCCNGAGNSRGFFDGVEIWFPSRDGVVTVDTRHVHMNEVVPNVVVEDVRYGGSWHAADGSLRIPARDRDLAFRFSVLSFQNPLSVQLAYRLRGYEDDWKSLDDVTRRTVNYTNLPPGDYVFEVRGGNNAGVWAPDAASLALTIQPRYYESWWFRVIAVLVTGLLGYGIYRLKVRNLRRQREYLEQVVAERTEALRQLNRQLEDASQTDPLTGLKNRRYLGQQLPSDLAHFRRERERPGNKDQVMAFAIADLDHFKDVNDRQGHFAGDALLKQVGEVLVKSGRAGHYVARWGGEEFLVVFRPMPRDEVAHVVARIHKAVGETRYELPSGDIQRITCSVGFAEYPFIAGAPDRVDWEMIVNLADHALYAAKAAGRNRWYGLRPGTKFDAGTIRDDLAKGLPGCIKAKKLVLVKTETTKAGKKRGG